MTTYLVEKDLSLAENVLQLGQLQEIALQSLGVLIHLPQLVLQLLEGGLKSKEAIQVKSRYQFHNIKV